ncbi:MAG: hypothetical protein WC320_01010 [Candidatus Paceibacterota bacterium]|jgi:ribosome-associated translation inhibitor RaiA
MNIRIIPINITLLDQQKEYLEKNLRTLERITKRYGDVADLTVNIGRITSQQQTGKIFFAEAKFAIPGKDIACKVEGNSIKDVTKKLRNNLKNLIVKEQDLKEDRFKKLGRFFKEKLRW